MTEKEHQEWEWDFDAQLYKHLSCNTHVSEGTSFCAGCEKRCPAIRTLGDLEDFIHLHDLHRDEYFGLWEWRGRECYYNKTMRRWPLGTKDTRWVVAYWVVGGNEGFYVHVDVINAGIDVPHRQIVALGKFWDWERAEFAAQLVQRWINGEGDTAVRFEKIAVEGRYHPIYRCVACNTRFDPDHERYAYLHAHGACPLESCPTNFKEEGDVLPNDAPASAEATRALSGKVTRSHDDGESADD